MSNEMISVPRNKLETLIAQCLDGAMGNPDLILNELRALLAKPAARPEPSCIQDLERFESDGEDYVKVADVLDMLGNLKAAEHQGEPMDWIIVSPEGMEPVKGLAYTKEHADKYAVAGWSVTPVYARPAAPTVPTVPTVPDGYCIMPKKLTAENGAKALLLGEFTLQSTHECPECRELEEPSEGCEICDGEGEYGQQHTIPWDQIKFIYAKAVGGLTMRPDTCSTTSDKYKAELYDEVWQLARDMGFGNVTDALMKLQSQLQGKKFR